VVVRRSGETRRAKLFYLRQRVGKAVRLTETRKARKDDPQSAQPSQSQQHAQQKQTDDASAEPAALAGAAT
jgi:hypothetical protein